MRFQLLGPVQAIDAGRRVDLGPPKQRALLALLLLEERPVSLERAVDELWLEPPATAAKMVQIYVSGLRRSLGASSIRTTRAGYELEADGADVDVRRFRELRDAAEREPELAASHLHEALALWQGEPLSDLVGEPFADRERSRLEDERLDAVEDRIAAELALGSRSDAGELQALVARHPYRERLRRLLILALYRSGRQADALEAYQEAVRVLRDDLGLEPSKELRDLELAVLRQDPSLDAPRVEAAGAAPRRSRRLAAVALAVLALVAAIVAALVLRNGSSEQITANHAAALDPQTAHVSDVVPVGLRPTTITSVGNRFFVASGEDNSILALDGRTGNRIRSIPVGGTVTSLSGDGRFLWAVEFYDRDVLRIPIDAVGAATQVRLPYANAVLVGGREHPMAVAATPGGAWIGTDQGRLFFARSGGAPRRVATLDLPIRALAYAPPFLWIAAPRVRSITGSEEQPGEVIRFDLRTQATQSVPVGVDPSALAVVGSGVWAATQASGKVYHVSGTAELATIVDLHTQSLAEGACSSGLLVGCPGSMDTAGRFLWVPSARDRTVYRVELRPPFDVEQVRAKGDPVGVAPAAGNAWVVAG